MQNKAKMRPAKAKPISRSPVKDAMAHRIKLVSRPALLSLSVATITLLWLLKPNDNLLISLIDESENPYVAIAFIQVLQKNQSSLVIDLALAKQKYRISEFNETVALLEPLSKFDDSNSRLAAHRLYPLALLRMAADNPKAKNKLIAYLQTFPVDLPAEQRQLLASYAMQIGRPAEAFQILSRLPDQELPGLLKLALQGNLIADAVYVAKSIYQREPSQANLLQLLNLMEQVGQGAEALVIAKNHQLKKPCDVSCLDYLTKLSLRQSAHESAALYALLKANITHQLEDIHHTADLLTSAGKLAEATAYLEKQNERKQSLSIFKKLHQYYRWQQNTDKALLVSQQIVKESPDKAAVINAIQDANAESDVAATADFYFLLSKHQPLTDEQLKTFVNASDKSHGAINTLSRLYTMAQRYPTNAALRTEIGYFYLITGQPSKTIERLQPASLSKATNLATLKIVFDAFINLNQPQQALLVMSQNAKPAELSTEELHKLLELARYNGDIPLQRYYMNLLIQRKDHELDQFAAISIHKQPTKTNQQFLWQLYEKEYAVEILIALYTQSLETSDEALFQKVAEQFEKNHRSDTKLEANQLQIGIALHQQQNAKAKNLITKFLAKYPDYPSELKNAGWLALQTDDINWLHKLYPSILRLPKSDSAQLRLLGAITERLGYLQHSAHWYAQLNAMPDVSALDKLNYALVLERVGNLELAQQLRWTVVKQQSAALRKAPNGELTYQSLVASLVSPANAAAVLTKQMETNPSPQALSQLSITLQHNLAALNYYKQQLTEKALKINDTLALTLAMAADDKAAMRTLAFTSPTLTPLERASALIEIGEYAKAWQHTEEYDNPALLPQERAPLQRLAINLHPKRSHGWLAEHRQQNSWDVDTSVFQYYQPLKDGQFALTLQNDDAKNPPRRPRGFDRDYDSQSLELRWWSPLFDGNFEIDFATLLQQRLDNFEQGQDLAVSWHTTPRFTNTFNYKYEMPSTQGENLYLFGRETSLAWQTLWYADKYTQINTNLAHAEFETDFNESIAKQWQLQLQYNYMLSRVPNFSVYSQFDWQDNDLMEERFFRLNRFTDRPLNSLDFLAPEYQRLSIGQRFLRGNVGQPGPTAPHYRYLLDTSVGFNFVTDEIEYVVSAGFGTRILGSDELFIKTNWQNADALGRESLSIHFGYFFDF